MLYMLTVMEFYSDICQRCKKKSPKCQSKDAILTLGIFLPFNLESQISFSK